MTIIEMFSKELEKEAGTTRKMLERIPDHRYSWQPHEKSMTVERLANHIAELPSWAGMALYSDGIDFADNPYRPTTINNTRELLKLHDKNIEQARQDLSNATDDLLPQKWVLREGEKIYEETTKGDTLRMAFSQIIHHRAQLGVYLRLLNVPIPGSYGPSADDESF